MSEIPITRSSDLPPAVSSTSLTSGSAKAAGLTGPSPQLSVVSTADTSKKTSALPSTLSKPLGQAKRGLLATIGHLFAKMFPEGVETTAGKTSALAANVIGRSEETLEAPLQLSADPSQVTKPKQATYEGDVQEEHHSIGAKHPITEKAKRYPIKETNQQSLNQRLTKLTPGTPERAFCQKALNALRPNSAKNWVGSGDFRESLGSCSTEEEFIALCDKSVATTPVNMWSQGIEGGESFMRLGCITDPRMGMVSITDLEAMKSGPNVYKKTVEKLVKKYQAEKAKGKKTPTGKQLALAYTLSKIAPEVYQAVKNDQVPSIKVETREAILTPLMEERTFIIQQQALLLLNEQIKLHPTMIQPDGTFTMVHIGLLDPEKQKVEKNGLVENERTMIQDMKKAYELLNGKEIFLDAENAPYLDTKGNVHLPRPEGMTQEKITVKTAFVNVSVQGGVFLNSQFQKEFNKNGLDDLAQVIGTQNNEFTKAVKELRKGPCSSYSLAEALGKACLDNKTIALSIDCKSAKDRTGMLGWRLIYRQLKDTIGEGMSSLLAHLREKIVSSEGIAARIAAQNTGGSRVLKCSSLTFPGISVWKRFLYLITDQRKAKKEGTHD